MRLVVSETPIEDLKEGEFQIYDGLETAFDKKYFYKTIVNAEGQVLTIFKLFDIIIQGVTKKEVFVKFVSKNK